MFTHVLRTKASGPVVLAAVCLSLAASLASAQAPAPAKVEIDWNKTILVSKSTPTLQVVTNPMLNPGAPIHDGSFAALKALGADYVRYVPWLPYPKIAVVELDAPTKEKASWDFTYADPVTKDFLAATEGHSTIMNFSTIPSWMFKTDKPVEYPADPNQVFWNYTQGTELRDPSGKELGDYFGRLVSWYTKGGFTDENGKRHESGYHYTFPYWEVLNEVDAEHTTTPEDYTKRYDFIVEGIRKVSPQTKFMGMALAWTGKDPRYYEYFLNHKNHKPGIPLDFISYHFYASPASNEGLDSWEHTFFNLRLTASSPPRASSSPSAIVFRPRLKSIPMSWASFSPTTTMRKPKIALPSAASPTATGMPPARSTVISSWSSPSKASMSSANRNSSAIPRSSPPSP